MSPNFAGSTVKIVETREDLSIELRHLMVEESIDEETVLSLAEKYGTLDGEIVYYYVTHFAELAYTLSDEQKSQLINLRNLDDFLCNGAYLYSENISLPVVIDSDFLFGVSID